MDGSHLINTTASPRSSNMSNKDVLSGIVVLEADRLPEAKEKRFCFLSPQSGRENANAGEWALKQGDGEMGVIY